MSEEAVILPPKQRTVSWMWGVVCGAAILPSLYINPAAFFDSFMPLTARSLQLPETIELGTLNPQEKQVAELSIRNVCRRRISLLPVETDCGCLVVHNAPTLLEIGQLSNLKVAIVAPSEPGSFSRMMLLRTPEPEGPIWKVSVRGNVVGRVWSEPNSVEMMLDENGSADTVVQIKHSDTFTVGRLAATSDAVQIVDSRTSDGRVDLSLRVADYPTSESLQQELAINVFQEGGGQLPALTIPVRLTRRSAIGYMPRQLELPQFHLESTPGEQFRRVIAVVVPPGRSAANAELSVLVPWVRIAGKQLEGSILRLELEFDPGNMPDEFQSPILTAKLAGRENVRDLIASGYR